MDDSQRQSNFTAPIVAMLISIVGIAMGGFGYLSFVAEQRFTSFTPVDAVVTESRTISHSSGYSRRRSLTRNRSYTTDVDFQYRDRSGQILKKSTKLTSAWSHPEWGPESSLDQGYFAPGRHFTVFVNANDYSDFSLERGPSRLTWGLMLLGVALALGGGFMFYPLLIALFKSDPGPAYLPSDDPRNTLNKVDLPNPHY